MIQPYLNIFLMKRVTNNDKLLYVVKIIYLE